MLSIKEKKNKSAFSPALMDPCPDYFPGDILLKRGGDDFVHKLIIHGQKLPGNISQDPHFVHAAIISAYCEHNQTPWIYEVDGDGLKRSEMSDEKWVCYRWPTDFDETFAQIMREGASQQFLEKSIKPLLKLVPNPFELDKNQVSLIKELLQSLELPAIIDKKLLDDGHELRQFVKACAIFELRERVVSWAKALCDVKNKIRYDKLGAFFSVLMPRFRASHITEVQLHHLRQQIEKLPTSVGFKFCSEFVVLLWTLPLLERLPAEMPYDELKRFLPINMNMKAASPADLHTHFQKNRHYWKTVINPAERYQVNLLKRILQTTITQDHHQSQIAKIKPLIQSRLWYEVLQHLQSLLSQTTSWSKGSFGRLILEALQPWHPSSQKFSYPFLGSQNKLLQAILKDLPKSHQKLIERIFPEKELAICHTYQDLLDNAEKSRATGSTTIETLHEGYVKPLSNFLIWVESIIATRPNMVLTGTHCLFKSAADYVNTLPNILSSRLLNKEEEAALALIEDGFLIPLASSWCLFLDSLAPHNVTTQVNQWGQRLLKAFLAKRSTAYAPTATHPLMTILEDYPDKTGWTVKAHQKTLGWQEKLDDLQAPEKCQTDYFIETIQQGKIKQHFLKQDIGKSIFESASQNFLHEALSKGKLDNNKRYTNDRHIFYRHGNILLKLQRQQGDTLFGNELVVHHLHDTLGLNVLPSSTLWRIYVKKGPHQGAYYCWASEFIEGDLLSHVMKKHPEKLADLSLQSVSELYVLTLAISQEDANPFNMSMAKEPPYHLSTFDVGHAFVLPLLQSWWRKTTQLELKSMVFLLPQMSSTLDLATQEKLALLDLPIWLDAQKKSLSELAQAWKQLLAKEKLLTPSLIQLPKTAWPWIEFILINMQSRLRKNPQLTHAALFSKLLPMVALHYHEKRLALSNNEAYRTFNFRDLNEKAYKEIIIRSPQGDIQTLTTSRIPEVIRKMHQQGSEQYLQLLPPLPQRKQPLQEDFYKAAKLKRDAFILLQILKVKGLKEIDLRNNLLVRDEHIGTLFKQSSSVTKLDVRDCSQLTGAGWLDPTLFSRCRKLKLEISGSALEDHFVWRNARFSSHVLSWTKPRKIFLDQFACWEERRWTSLESQPFKLPLTALEEVYLADNVHRYKTALNQQGLLQAASIKTLLEKGDILSNHPILRYRFLFELLNAIISIASGNIEEGFKHLENQMLEHDHEPFKEHKNPLIPLLKVYEDSAFYKTSHWESIIKSMRSLYDIDAIFFSGVKFEALADTPPFQKLILYFMEGLSFNTLDLSECSVLRDEDILNLTLSSPQLNSLKMTASDTISGEIWLELLITREDFETLTIANLDNATEAFRKRFKLFLEKEIYVPRKIFLDQFKQWEQSRWRSLENQPFNLPLTAPEEAYLAENVQRYKTALNQQSLLQSTSIKTLLEKGAVWSEHPLLRYRYLFELFKIAILGIPALDDSQPRYKVIVVGDTAVGKTQLIRRYVDNVFSVVNKSTLVPALPDLAVKIINREENASITLQLWDITGKKPYGNQTKVFYKYAAGAIIVFDATRPNTLNEAIKWRKNIYIKTGPIPVVLFVNKWDIKDEHSYDDKETLNKVCKENGFARWFSTSAKDNFGIEEGFNSLINQILKNDPELSKNRKTNLISLLKSYEESALHKTSHWKQIIKSMRVLYDIDASFFSELQFEEFNDFISFQKLVLSFMKGISFDTLDLSGCSVLRDEDILNLTLSSPQLISLKITASNTISGETWVELLMAREDFELLTIINIDNAPKDFRKCYESLKESKATHAANILFPRKTFLDQFNKWEESGWRSLESQPFNSPLNIAEENFLAENAYRYKNTLRNKKNMSMKIFLEKSITWPAHPILRYQFLFELFQRKARPNPKEYLYKVLVIGSPASGKTWLTKRYVYNIFSLIDKASIGVDFALKTIKWDASTVVRLQLWDIAGSERLGGSTKVYYKEAVGAVILFDTTRSYTLQNAIKWKEDIDKNLGPIPIVLLANKWDIKPEGLYEDKETMDELCKENGFFGWFSTSAKCNFGIEEGFNHLIAKILENDPVIKRKQKPLLKIYKNFILYENSHWEKITKTLRFLYDIDAGFFNAVNLAEFDRFHGLQKGILSLMKGVAFHALDLSRFNIVRDEDIVALIASSPQLSSLTITASDEIFGKVWLERLISKKDFDKLTVLNLANASIAFAIEYKAYTDSKKQESEKNTQNKVPTAPVQSVNSIITPDILPKKSSSPPLSLIKISPREGSLTEGILPRTKEHLATYFLTSQNKNKRSISNNRMHEKIITEGDGNCLYNVVSLGLCYLIKQDMLLKLPADFFTTATQKHQLPFQDMETFKQWIIDTPHVFQQKRLAPLLRLLAILHIESNYADYRSQFEAELKELFWRHTDDNYPDDNYFLEHSFIKEKASHPTLTVDKFIQWWQDEGKERYFKALKKPATHSLDKKRWGAGIELNALGLYLGINVTYHKGQFTDTFGVLGGIVPINNAIQNQDALHFTEEEANLLFNLGFGYRRSDCIHLFDELAPKLETYEALPQKYIALLSELMDPNETDLSVTINDVNNLMAQKSKKHGLTETEYESFCECLIKRDIIVKTTEENRHKLRFITEENGDIALQRIQQRIMGIPDSLRTKLLPLSTQEVPKFEVRFGNDHWEYLPGSPGSNFKEKEAAVNIMSKMTV